MEIVCQECRAVLSGSSRFCEMCGVLLTGQKSDRAQEWLERYDMDASRRWTRGAIRDRTIRTIGKVVLLVVLIYGLFFVVILGARA